MRTLGLLLILVVSALGRAENPRIIAQRNADAQRKAMLAKDISWYEKHQTADYYEVGVNGKRLSRAQALEGTKRTFSDLKSEKLEAKVLSATASGKDLVDVVEVRLQGQLMGPDKKPHKISVKARYKETWTKVGGEWKMRIQQTLSEQAAVDGHPLPSDE